MEYKLNQDFHIHSSLSFCSSDPEQSTENILKYAVENGFEKLCITDHFWDSAVKGASDWYAPQDYNHISQSKPLPQVQGVSFLFGCETELDKYNTLGLAAEHFDLFDFIIIPTTHLHMTDFTISTADCTVEGRAKQWISRLTAVLEMSLPFKKVGLAHLTCPLIAPASKEEYFKVLSLISDSVLEELFTQAAKLGVGIELNKSDITFDDAQIDRIMRPYIIARSCGCKFYFGSDSHHPADFVGAKAAFRKAAELLKLEEADRFVL